MASTALPLPLPCFALEAFNSLSTFDKLRNILHELIALLRNNNDYHYFFQTMMKSIDYIIMQGGDINCQDSEGNETFLSLFFYLFFDYGDCRVYNCKVYSPYILRIFRHILDMGADLTLKSYNSRYGHKEFEPEPMFAIIMTIMIEEFNERLNRQDNDEDSYLIYKYREKLVPFRFNVPDDPYPEYTESEMNEFYLMKFKCLSNMLDMVFRKMKYNIPYEYFCSIDCQIEFIEHFFVPVFPSYRAQALQPYAWFRRRNFILFFNEYRSSNSNLLILVNIYNPKLKKVLDIDELIRVILSYL